MLRHVMFVAGLGFLAVIAAVLYAQDLRSANPAEAAVDPTAAVERGDDSQTMTRHAVWSSRSLERVRSQLPITHEEWIVLRPKIEPIVDLQRELRRGGRFGRDDRGESAFAQATAELRSILESPEATNEEITSRVEAVRAARAGIEQQIEAAQQELATAVTDEEAARLILAGVLK